MLRIGIISDIHSHDFRVAGVQQGGYYYPSMPDSPEEKNPFASLKTLIRKEGITLDFLLSPGDFAHQVDPTGLKSAWDQLKLICVEVGAKLLVGTIGNHDVASRQSNTDSFAVVKGFDTDFPVYSHENSERLRHKLLENGYYTIENDDHNLQLIVVNSCFDHWDEVEASRGAVGGDFYRRIDEELANSTNELKILLVHHNPVVHETGIKDTADVITGGQEFMNSIADVDLVIHGHKHAFRFTQDKIYPKNRNILAAGSFSCYFTGQPLVLNSFQIVEFFDNEIANCVKHGVIHTYVYDPIRGWRLDAAQQEGFGCTWTEEIIQNNIKETIEREVKKEPHISYLEWTNIVQMVGQLKFISRKMRNGALDNLKTEGIIKRAVYHDSGVISDIVLR